MGFSDKLRNLVLCGVVAIGISGRVYGAQYGLVKDYSGAGFFNGWNFYNHYDDTMNGDVTFVSAENASAHHLAYVDPSTNRAIMKVDNTSFVPWNFKRDSVRIATQETWGIGSVWAIDVWHAPFGCSVWPALWTFSPNSTWPAGGEIDIFEGVNLSPSSQMGLHTTAGCTQVSPNQTSTIINGTNCEGGAGCIVTNNSPASYGQAFANAQGGVFVAELATSGVSIWFFERQSVPDVFKNNETKIDTSAFGMPMGNWPSGSCNIGQFFSPQNLVFDITLCGDFAGSPQFFPQTCSGDCYLDYVINNGTSQYANAYFDVGYVRVFSANSNGPTSSSGASGTSSGTSGGSRSNGAVGAGGRVRGMMFTGGVGIVVVAVVFKLLLY